MKFVLIRPFDDKDIVELIAIQHKNQYGMALHFSDHWEKALKAVKKFEPETWNIDQVFQYMENKYGWTIMKLNATTEEY